MCKNKVFGTYTHIKQTNVSPIMLPYSSVSYRGLDGPDQTHPDCVWKTLIGINALPALFRVACNIMFSPISRLSAVLHLSGTHFAAVPHSTGLLHVRLMCGYRRLATHRTQVGPPLYVRVTYNMWSVVPAVKKWHKESTGVDWT